MNLESNWPACWLFSVTSEGANNKINLGSRMRNSSKPKADAADTVLTYICHCGAEHSRNVGEDIKETNEWVEHHIIHLPVSELPF